MCAPTVLAIAGLATTAVGVGLQAVSARRQVESQNQAAEFNAAVSRRNAESAELQAKDAEARGEIEEKKFRQRISKLKGKQRAALGASGVVVDQGSALDVLEDTEVSEELDALTIRRNAAREAQGFRTQAANFSNQSSLSLSSRGNPGLAFGTTLLTGATTFADRAFRFAQTR